jgi:hypothetical protein
VGSDKICARDADELAVCFKAHAGELFGYACVVTRGTDDHIRRPLDTRTAPPARTGRWTPKFQGPSPNPLSLHALCGMTACSSPGEPASAR